MTAVSEDLFQHLERESVEYVHFAFRWMLCLLSRELNSCSINRLWDTYLAEGVDSFPTFHIYVCTAFLLRFNTELRELDFSDMVLFLQHLPTDFWTEKETGELIKKAYTIGQLERTLGNICMLYFMLLVAVILILCVAFLLSILLANAGFTNKKFQLR